MSKNGFRTTVRDVTPEQAAAWLASRRPGRTISSPLVMTMARDMISGRWQLTHQGIALDAEDRLLDGQHRLSAVIAADKTVPMMVSVGLPLEACLVMDDHRRRSGADVLSIDRGEAVETLLVAILQLMEKVQTGGGSRFSKAELADAYERYGEAARFAFSAISKHVRGVTIAPVLAPVARAYFHEDHDRLLAFQRVLASGVPETTPGDNAALRLRDWLIEHRESRRRPTRLEVFQRSQSALRHFLDQRDVQSIRVSAGELFVVPDDLRMPRSTAEARLTSNRSLP